MTALALPVSQSFDAVLPHIERIVGAFVLRNFERVPPGKDLTVHINGFIDETFERQVTPVFLDGLRRHQVRLFSFDLGPSCQRIRMEDCYLPESSTLTPEEILKIGEGKLSWVRRHFAGVLSVENLDYHRGGAYEYVCEPDFIRRALETWDVGLTLDLAHLNVTCHNVGLVPEDFLRRLPRNRIRELHVSHAEGADDEHGLPREEDYSLVERVLRDHSPDYVVLESYWEPSGIVQANRRLMELIRAAEAEANSPVEVPHEEPRHGC